MVAIILLCTSIYLFVKENSLVDNECCIVGFVVFQTICQRQGDWRDGTQTNRALLQCGAIQRTEGLQVSHGGLVHFRNVRTACHNKAIVVLFTKEGSWSAQYWIGKTLFLTGIWTERMMQAGETIEGASFVSSAVFVTTKHAISTLFSTYFLWHPFFIICQKAPALVQTFALEWGMWDEVLDWFVWALHGFGVGVLSSRETVKRKPPFFGVYSRITICIQCFLSRKILIQSFIHKSS